MSDGGAGAVTLEGCLERGGRRWPQLGDVASAFRARFEAVLPTLDPSAPFHAEDAWLVAAFLAGNERALLLLREAIHEAAHGRWLWEKEDRRELESAVSEELLVAGKAGEAPGIGRYQGRGPLAAFLRVACLRHARILARRAQRETPAEEALFDNLVGGEATPELAVLKEQLRGELADSLRLALAALPVDKRLLLKQHYLDGVSADRLAQLHGTHRATVCRWMASARDEFLELVRNTVAEKLGVRRLDVDSIVRFVQSQLDVSFSLLRSSNEPA